MADIRAYQVSEVAQMTGISVRTLHYYDEIGLLVPGDRSPAGYRLYDEGDLLRLQQILIGRSLGLSLEDIRQSLDDPAFDYGKSLRRQRSQLVKRLSKTHKMIAAIDETLASLDAPAGNINFKAIFDGFDPAHYEDEAQTRWGDSNAYVQSARRTKNYTAEDWAVIKRELHDIWADAARLMQNEISPTEPEAVAIAERHRQHICLWFYDLSTDMHAYLAQMWLVDERFKENIDKHGEGLTEWVAQAVKAAA